MTFPRTKTAGSRSSAAVVIVVALVAGACGSGSSGSSTANEAAASLTAGAENVALYDNSVVHDIAVTFDQAAYDTMVDTYVSTKDKDWIEARITIDGVTLDKVGMRLKGNSSLRGLARAGGGGGTAGGTSRSQPESLPWLVRLDKYVDGQSYQGHTEIVIRGNNSKTSLNEAVALELIGLAGDATEDAFATRFSVNGGGTVLRLAIELPNDEWAEETFDGEGIVYKAESTGDYSYRGTDPAAYDEVFDQETDRDNENLTPLIAFLDFINNSSDAVFAAELGKHLDVDAFARYLAIQELLGNWDDIDGPGNNSYLRYDEATDKFTVLSWDLNLAFGGAPGANMGAAPAAGGATPPAGGMPPGAVGVAPPGAVGVAPPGAGGAAPPGAGGAVRRGGPGGRSNVLVQRFQANAHFAVQYSQAKTDLTAKLFTSGQAGLVLDRWVDVLKTSAADVVDAATIDREAAAIRENFD